MEKYYIPFTKVGSEMEKYWVDKGCNFLIVDDFDLDLLTFVNSYRTENNVDELQINENLNNAALGHAIDMLCNDYYSHISLIKTTPANRVVAAGYSFSHLFENLNKREVSNSRNLEDPLVIAEGSLKAWISSELHRLALQNSEVANLGAAAVCVIQTKNNIPQQKCLIVAEFAKPYK